ncbi:membrane protein [Clostridia bacterium]|nr:membrane protein [Clostridia bacterium]
MRKNNLMTDNPIRSFGKNRKEVCVLVGILMVFVVFVCVNRLPQGHDMGFSFLRIHSIALEMANGKFWPVHYYSNLPFGGAIPLFYPDWFLFFPGLIEWLGLSTYHAYKMFVILCVIAMALSMYVSANIILRDKKAALFAAIAYFTASYTITNAFIRCALGELQSMIFVPLAFAGLYAILYQKNTRKWLLLPLGMTGLLGCHLLGTMMTAFILALFVVLSYRKITWRVMADLAKSVLLTIVLSATFVFPFVEQMLSVHGTQITAQSRVAGVAHRALPLDWHLFTINHGMINDIASWRPPGIGLLLPVVLLFCFLGCWKLKSKKQKIENKAPLFLLLALLSLVFTTNIFLPYGWFDKALGFLQFPWRFLVFVTMFTAIAAAAVYQLVKENRTMYRAFLTLSVLAIVAVPLLFVPRLKAEMLGGAFDPASRNTWGDYLPDDANEDEYVDLDITYEPSVAMLSGEMEQIGGAFILHFEKKAEAVAVQFPATWYKGFSAKLDNGETLATAYGNNDVVRVILPAEEQSGVLTVQYTGTVIQKIAASVSLLGFVGLLVGFIVSLRKKKGE